MTRMTSNHLQPYCNGQYLDHFRYDDNPVPSKVIMYPLDLHNCYFKEQSEHNQSQGNDSHVIIVRDHYAVFSSNAQEDKRVFLAMLKTITKSVLAILNRYNLDFHLMRFDYLFYMIMKITSTIEIIDFPSLIMTLNQF